MKIQLKHPYDKLAGELADLTGLSPTQLTIQLMQELQTKISKTSAQEEAKENNNNVKVLPN
ncbi:hypothetical protein ACP75B_15435 [Vibrio cholerae]|uniref:Uncharacterized protein n=1 Tax=Vibrio cholerae serotype O1 biovar El Tor TaxID=686 RepID=M1R9I0_VIBCE|nr:hypothetical protein [Vibrio cholerae]AGG09404.1 hypothetical protein [Vibrio cholerae O1 biovar El Tor]EGQ8257914.1 hypothetical protein [Vibrio cholerae]EGR0460985.1 hypothetical protein [Vibrio cholerae]EGR0472546.1 hypothetical protein [Vibrio cholerae]EGR0514280.1 hypothetical protein [Vibrio cholerae]